VTEVDVPARSRLDWRDEPEVAVVVDDVHVRYRVYEEQRLGLRELLARGFRSRRSSQVHAIRGVSFRIDVGEAVGIVGANGSGKSTLLRAIAGVQSIASGHILARGDVRLLGVGAALKPTLSGYRNVMLGGLAMGLTEAEVEARMSEVIEFSGLADAINRPLKTYSSGMRARLAFSIATLYVPDVLLIDEALAVGDKEFRERSLQRIRDIQQQAGTVVMVTHNMSEIRTACSRAIWLDDGVVRADGAVDDVLAAYDSR
jgi:teichoic acid transport system ATP-binding protein